MRRPISSSVGVRPSSFSSLVRGPPELVHALVHVHRDADGARLVCDGQRDRLADPPGGVCRKLVAAPVFEFVSRTHQADVAFLEQIQQVQSAVHGFLSNRNHQPEVGLHQIFLGPLGFLFAVPDDFQCVLEIGERRAYRGLALTDFLFQLACTVPGVDADVGLDLLHLPLEMGPLFNCPLDLLRKLFPLHKPEGDPTDG